MTQKHFILATAGHVDHGKTALVRALTGVDTDRLPEEKARGITIDLGFAHLALPSTINDQPSTLSIGLIDVPGHEDFIRNMIAGIGAIDLALLVVAADDGWMPQTEEHLQILEYLRVPRALVVITKSDLGALESRTHEAREKLQGTCFAAAPVVATSVRDGSGIELLKETLAREFAGLPSSPDIGKPRLFVDRVFTLRGTGTVVTGSLTGGRFARGETIQVQPQKLTARIRAIQSHNRPIELAGPGTRTAFNLPELKREQIARGAVITALDSGESTATVDVLLERSKRLSPTARPLKNGALVHVHFGSGRFIARTTLLDRREVLAGEEAIARLRFSGEAFVFAGDRFIIRDSAEQQTIGGGIILDSEAEATEFRSARQRALLAARAKSPNDCLTVLSSLAQRDHVAARVDLLRQSRFSREEVEAAIRRLHVERVLMVTNEFVADANWWQHLLSRAAAAIDAQHEAHPDRTGLEINQLRSALNVEPHSLFDALLAHLCTTDFLRSRDTIKRVTHRPSLPPQLHAAADRVRAQLSARPLDPPSRKELAPDASAQQALRFLCQTNEVIALNDDALLSAEAFAQLRAQIAQYLGEEQSATISELRQALGSTRRILVPLLERLDRDGLTIRRADRRSLRT